MLSEKFLHKCVYHVLMLLVLSHTSSNLLKVLYIFQILGDILPYFHKEYPLRRTRVPAVAHTCRRAIRQARPAQPVSVGTSMEGDSHGNPVGSSNPPFGTAAREEKLVKNDSPKPTCRPRLKKLRRHMSNLFLGCCRGGAEKP
ncbi:hypothetical protein ECG_07468 [Echinococcus granulosus]|nr:hypothetical protein ECG_07468 [Echinococcus granulosus]